jgi:glyoxylase-like metal-dependent hydrolase (beta-lactamase superfamily II)/rhodanese-related sulfurtransferase
MNIVIEQINPQACRTYLLAAEGSPEVVLVDPVLERTNDYLELLHARSLHLTHVIDTHTHADHISGCAALRDQTGCEYVMHSTAPAPCATMRVTDGDNHRLGGASIRFMHTPGHTGDSLCLILPDSILTGDTLFLDDGGAGRDDLPGGDPGAHWDSLQRLLTLPEHLIVHPAHEYRNRAPASLGVQKERNPHLQPRSKEEFERYLEDLKLGPAEWMKDVLKANYACTRDPNAAFIPTDVPACEVKGTMLPGVGDVPVTMISAAELKRRLDAAPAPVLLDVREDKELSEELGHLEGIRHIPIGGLSGSLGDLDAHRKDDIVTICRTGGRAKTAAQIMTKAGFDKVTVLEGGMTAWRSAGFPSSRSPKK